LAIRHGPPDESETFDVCVVGAGPAGLAAALACGARGCSVVLLEAGGAGPSPSVLPPAQILTADVHAPLNVTTRAGLGGTSSVWGGLCVPFDPSDFEKRSWVPESGWPITYTEVSKWYVEAARFLDCGDIFENTEPAFAPPEVLNVRQLGRLARCAALGTIYRNALAASRSIIVCLEAPVAKVICEPGGAHVIGVDVASGQGLKRIRAQRIVLAAGGLGTTRMLLELARA
jgi:hypothetical protein